MKRHHQAKCRLFAHPRNRAQTPPWTSLSLSPWPWSLVLAFWHPSRNFSIPPPSHSIGPAVCPMSCRVAQHRRQVGCGVLAGVGCTLPACRIEQRSNEDVLDRTRCIPAPTIASFEASCAKWDCADAQLWLDAPVRLKKESGVRSRSVT